MHRGEDCMYGCLSTPTALRQKAPLSDFPAQPSFAEADPLFSCVCLSDFSKREEKVKFSSVSPRESELSGKKCPCKAKKGNKLISSSWVLPWAAPLPTQPLGARRMSARALTGQFGCPICQRPVTHCGDKRLPMPSPSPRTVLPSCP